MKGSYLLSRLFWDVSIYLASEHRVSLPIHMLKHTRRSLRSSYVFRIRGIAVCPLFELPFSARHPGLRKGVNHGRYRACPYTHTQQRHEMPRSPQLHQSGRSASMLVGESWSLSAFASTSLPSATPAHDKELRSRLYDERPAMRGMGTVSR